MDLVQLIPHHLRRRAALRMQLSSLLAMLAVCSCAVKVISRLHLQGPLFGSLLSQSQQNNPSYQVDKPLGSSAAIELFPAQRLQKRCMYYYPH